MRILLPLALVGALPGLLAGSQRVYETWRAADQAVAAGDYAGGVALYDAVEKLDRRGKRTSGGWMRGRCLAQAMLEPDDWTSLRQMAACPNASFRHGAPDTARLAPLRIAPDDLVSRLPTEPEARLEAYLQLSDAVHP